MEENNAYNPYACYELKIGRVFYLFEKRRRVFLICYAVFCIFYILAQILMDRGSGLASAAVTFLICVIALVVWIFAYPGKIRLMPNSISIKHNYPAFYLLIKRPRVLSAEHTHDLNFRVYNIENIEFFQSPIEKKLNVGRVRFTGVVSRSFQSESGARKGEYTVYGLKNFEYSKDFIKKHVHIKTDNKST